MLRPRRTRAIAYLAVAFGAIVGSSGLSPAVASAAPASVCALAPSSIAVVVDFGDGSPVSAVCVPSDSGDNSAQLLGARAELLGTAAPRFNASTGLLCAIDGVPSDGCGEQTGSKYAYWSYWHGDGNAWQYSTVGPGGTRVRADRVEGWRFQPEGAGNPTDPPPRGSPDPAATCAPETTTTAAVVTETTAGPAAPVTTTSGSVTTTPATEPTTTTIRLEPGSDSAFSDARVRVQDRGGGSGSSALPVLGAGALVAALGVGGVVITRRRSAS